MHQEVQKQMHCVGRGQTAGSGTSTGPTGSLTSLHSIVCDYSETIVKTLCMHTHEGFAKNWYCHNNNNNNLQVCQPMLGTY